MAGYLPDEATAAAFADGWYRTGDVGWLEPEGWVHLTDRSKEMIKVSGFQVAPAEIEAVLHGHPAVIDCAVFGVPDERAGEIPVAAVQLEPGSAVSADHLHNSSPTRWPPTNASITSSSSTPSPGRPRARCCAARSGTSGSRPPRPPSPTDGRPPFARAGRPPRCRRTGRGSPRRARRCRARRPRACRQARRCSARFRLAELRTAMDDRTPWASAVEVALVAEELGRGLADAAFVGATLAAELRRLSRRARPSAVPETVGAARRPRGAGHGRGRPRASGCCWRWTPAPRQQRWWAWAAPTAGPSGWSRSLRPSQQHRPAASTSPGPSRRSTHREPSPPLKGRPIRSAARTWRPGRASAWP